MNEEKEDYLARTMPAMTFNAPQLQVVEVQ